MKKVILSPHVPVPIGPYSQATLVQGFLYCSGQIPMDPKTNEIVGSGDVKAQTEQVMKNIDALLKAGGCQFNDIIKTTIFLTSMADFPVVNEIYGRFFSKGHEPARSTVAVSALPKAVQVEIEVLAYRA